MSPHRSADLGKGCLKYNTLGMHVMSCIARPGRRDPLQLLSLLCIPILCLAWLLYSIAYDHPFKLILSLYATLTHTS